MVALVCHAHNELVPDERCVLRVVEHVPLQDLAVRDRDVAPGKAIPVQQTAKLSERRVHRRDLHDVPSRLIHLNPIAELIEAHRHEDDPADDVEERFLHDVDQRRGDQSGPEQAVSLRAAAQEDEEDERDRRRPDDIRHKLEVGEDVRLVSHVAPERRAEHRTEDLEEGFRRHEDRDDVDPRRERRQVQGRGGKPRDLDDPAEDEDPEQDDERDPDPEERSRLAPSRDLHTWSERGPRYLMTVSRLSRLKGACHLETAPRGRRNSHQRHRKLHGTA